MSPVAVLTGKCALVTGATVGLGLAIAKALAASGCNVALNNIVPPDDGNAIASALAQEFGIAAIYEQADLSAVPQIERLVSAAAAHLGAIDIVVNNAVVRHFAPIE